MSQDLRARLNGSDADDETKIFTDRRVEARRPNERHDKLATITDWDPRVAVEICLRGVEHAVEVFAKYGFDQSQAIELIGNPIFQKQLKDYKAEFDANGMTFRMKARILAEDLLPEAYDIAKDTTYPPAVRADMIQWITKIADLEPQKTDGKNVANQGGFSLQILFAGHPPSAVAVSQPLTIEGEAQ